MAQYPPPPFDSNIFSEKRATITAMLQFGKHRALPASTPCPRRHKGGALEVCRQRSSVTSSSDARIYRVESKSGLAPDQQCPPFRAREMRRSVGFLTTNLDWLRRPAGTLCPNNESRGLRFAAKRCRFTATFPLLPRCFGLLFVCLHSLKLKFLSGERNFARREPLEIACLYKTGNVLRCTLNRDGPASRWDTQRPLFKVRLAATWFLIKWPVSGSSARLSFWDASTRTFPLYKCQSRTVLCKT